MKSDSTGLTQSANRHGTILMLDGKGSIVSKECKSCKELKTLPEFRRHPGGTGGRLARCTDCLKVLEKIDRRENPEKYNTEAQVAYRKKYFETYYIKNSDVIRGRSSEHYYANRDDPDFIRQRLESKRRWAQENPEMITAQNHRRLAVKNSLPNSFTTVDMAKTLEHFDYRCALTGSSGKLHWDHVIPLSSGFGGSLPWNMLPIKPVLNISKSGKHALKWFGNNKERFQLSQERFEASLDYLAKLKGVTKQEYIAYIDECFTTTKGAK